MKNFKFELKQKIKIEVSGEAGVVIGRGEFTNSANEYRVRYKKADGCALESWWAEDALVAVLK